MSRGYKSWAGLTVAYQALFMETGMKEGDNVLIHAVGTGLPV